MFSRSLRLIKDSFNNRGYAREFLIEEDCKLINVVLDFFWEWTNYEQLTIKDVSDDSYLSPILLRRLKEKISGLFHELIVDYWSGHNVEVLSGKYEGLINDVWSGLFLIIDGVIPDWAQTKEVSDLEDMLQTNINYQTIGEANNEIINYLRELLGISNPKIVDGYE